MADFYDNLPSFRGPADTGAVAQRAQNPSATVAAFPAPAPAQPGPSLRDQFYALPIAPGRTVGDIFASSSGVDPATGAMRPAASAVAAAAPAAAPPGYVAPSMVSFLHPAQGQSVQDAAYKGPRFAGDYTPPPGMMFNPNPTLNQAKILNTMRPPVRPARDALFGEYAGGLLQTRAAAQRSGNAQALDAVERKLQAVFAPQSAMSEMLLQGQAPQFNPQQPVTLPSDAYTNR